MEYEVIWYFYFLGNNYLHKVDDGNANTRREIRWNLYKVGAIGTKRKCLLYRDVRFIVCPPYRDSTVNFVLNIK